MSPLPSAHRPPSEGAPLEEGDTLSHDIRSPQSSPLETGYSLTTDTGTLANMTGRLRSSLPTNCLLLSPEDLKVAGTLPIDAGGFADILFGELGDQKIAIKSYRHCASTDYTQIYRVSNTQL